MPVIRPISDLRAHAHELSELCHDSGEPIFLTKYGRGDMVLMSLAAYEGLLARLELYRELDEAEAEAEAEERAGDRGMTMQALRRQLAR
ncbi:MAG TPA: type II toxin-antitoxin system Phd/YefM family antitoxin [Kofleriaceae bacterium]|nr:type II toxin-antitoxin system Phd/YefM family antitoxin [Kofleriaceae bacterium]